MKIGVNISIDVTKIDKAKLYKGQKGTYLNLTAFISDQTDQYGNNGIVKQQSSKEEREQGVEMPILGNSKIFWGLEQSQDQTYQQPQQNPAMDQVNKTFGGGEQIPDDDIDSIPF